MNVNYDTLPEHMRDSARRYVENGESVGSFLTAVLENNLVEALGRADMENRAAIFAWTSWLYNDAPMDAWGSPEKVVAWLGIHAKEAGGASIMTNQQPDMDSDVDTEQMTHSVGNGCEPPHSQQADAEVMAGSEQRWKLRHFLGNVWQIEDESGSVLIAELRDENPSDMANYELMAQAPAFKAEVEQLKGQLIEAVIDFVEAQQQRDEYRAHLTAAERERDALRGLLLGVTNGFEALLTAVDRKVGLPSIPENAAEREGALTRIAMARAALSKEAK